MKLFLMIMIISARMKKKENTHTQTVYLKRIEKSYHHRSESLAQNQL